MPTEPPAMCACGFVNEMHAVINQSFDYFICRL